MHGVVLVLLTVRPSNDLVLAQAVFRSEGIHALVASAQAGGEEVKLTSVRGIEVQDVRDYIAVSVTLAVTRLWCGCFVPVGASC